MADFFMGWGFTVAALLGIFVVFCYAYLRLRYEIRWVALLSDYLAYAAVPSEDTKPAASLEIDQVRDQVSAVLASDDPASANKIVRGWQMRVQRLEPALAFWVDLLRQLGLLFTVLGLGLSMAVSPTEVTDLMRPVGLAVWTTVAGLALSILLTANFGMKAGAWTDAGEKNIEIWDHKRRERRQS